jgi:hypothetical protein
MKFIGCLLGDFIMVDCCDFFVMIGWLIFLVMMGCYDFMLNDCFKFGLQVWQVGLCKMGEPHSKYIYICE